MRCGPATDRVTTSWRSPSWRKPRCALSSANSSLTKRLKSATSSTLRWSVDDVALFKRFVKLEFADDRAQRGLRQLGDRHDVVTRSVAGPHRIGHLKIQDAIDLQLGVVTRDADLAGDVQG